MSEMYIVQEVIKLASVVVGKAGPIEIDTGIYSHNILLKESGKGDDIRILGEAGGEITLKELVKMFSELDSIIDGFNDARTFSFSRISQISDKRFAFQWGS